MLNKWLFTQIDNSALIVFRMLFGALIALEAFGAIFTGWVRRTLIEPDFTFNFIGFGFLQPLPGNGMLWYFALMGVFGLLVMLGFKYRLSIFMYGVMWAGVYLMQKSSYNNHYYLLMLVCFLMLLLPAHKYGSVDAKRNPSIIKYAMPQWCWLLIVVQLWIVYTYAAIAKLYPDWWNGSFINLLMIGKKDFWLVGDFLQQGWVHYSMAYFGFFFDLLIIPLMLYRKTRIFAFASAVFFHLFNSFVFHIGIFPYLSLAFLLFFFRSEKIHRFFLSKKPFYEKNEILVPSYKRPLLIFLSVWFVVQISLPLRHWFFQDNVLWTEEGHRLSWRMMLRSKAGRTTFKIVDKETGDTTRVVEKDYLSPKQVRAVSAKPDLMWQFAQYLEKQYAEEGKEIEVYVDSKVKVNQRDYVRFINPEVDLAAEEWKHFSHNDWILPSSLD